MMMMMKKKLITKSSYHINKIFILIIGIVIGSAISTIFCTISLDNHQTGAGIKNNNDGPSSSSSSMVMIPHPKSHHLAKQHNGISKKKGPVVVVDDHKHHKTKNSSSLINYLDFYPNGTVPRAYPYWPTDIPLPCFDRPWSFQEELKVGKIRKQGFLFLKPIKVGSSTALGVNLRIAEKEAIRRQQQQQQNNNSTTTKNNNNNSIISTTTFQNIQFVRCAATHTHCNGYEFATRIKSQSFLWSIIRDPTSRVISEFFHFLVSREKLEPTLANLQKSIKTNKVANRDYYIKRHYVGHINFKTKPTEEIIMKILNDYDFFGITERFDESLVVLQQLLRLPLSDILYLDAKRAGNYDDGGLRQTCFYIVPSFITPGMKEYFASSEWQDIIKKDMIFYAVANASLTKTIEETIGRTKFDLALHKFRYAQKLINDVCSTDIDTNFPCTSDGVFVPPASSLTDCYYKDSGCGKRCIDRIVEQNKHNDIFT